jgi:hypothetical protein
MRGDEADIVKEFYPNEDWRRRRVRLDELRREYQRQTKPSQQAPVNLRGGPGSQGPKPAPKPDDMNEVGWAWADLTKHETDTLIAARAVMQDKAKGISFESLAEYCVSFETWIRESEQRHLAECIDADCDAFVCRAARGLPPLTKDEIEAGRREEAKRRQYVVPQKDRPGKPKR